MEDVVQSVIEDVVGKEESSPEEQENTNKPEQKKKQEAGESEKLVDPEKFCTGLVREWKSTWGFILNDETKDTIFVHVTSVKSRDHHVFLRKGMQVRYQEAIRVDRPGPHKKCAANVTALDGSPISFFERQGEHDAFERTLIEPGVKFLGTVKNYFFKRRFGWITPDIEEDEPRHFLKKDIYVGREDIYTKDFPPGLRVGTKVEFQLYEDDRGLGACNVTGMDGEPIEANTVRKDYSDIVFTGVIVKFRVHGYVFIKSDESLKEFGVWGEDVHGLCEDINTDLRPARILEGHPVQFKLSRDENGFHAIDICNTDGTPIQKADKPTADEQEDAEEAEKRLDLGDAFFTGFVKSFSWSKGTGWIETGDLPGEYASKSTRENQVYFYRKDLISNDKVFGVGEGAKVKFQLYSDDKGLGAKSISHENGDAFEGEERPKENRNLQHGVINYFDRQKKLVHIRFKGRIHAVPRKHCIVLPRAEKHLRKGQKVEFMVERWRGRNFLKQVSFPGRRAEPRVQNDHQPPPHFPPQHFYASQNLTYMSPYHNHQQQFFGAGFNDYGQFGPPPYGPMGFKSHQMNQFGHNYM